MYRVTCVITTTNGEKDCIANEKFGDIAAAEYFVEELRSFLPELGSIVDWAIHLVIPGSETQIYSMDDEQSEHDHRILIRDNMDAAHYSAHMKFVVKD